jgi:hypothetical protein
MRREKLCPAEMLLSQALIVVRVVTRKFAGFAA